MEYEILGKTGRKVSRIGFGGATAGLKDYIQKFDPQNNHDRTRIIDAIRRALELGINYFDTAAAYGDGQSECIFGEGLGGVQADKIFLATKVGIWNENIDVRKALEESLKRLKRDRLDLFQLHGTVYTDEQENWIFKSGGVIERLLKLKEEGLVKYIGFTVEAQDECAFKFMKCGYFDCMQICYNLLFQHAYDPGWKCGSIFDAEKNGLGIIAMRSATSGIFQKWVKLVNPANTFDYTPSLIQFELSNPLVDVALIGMRTVAQVEENVAICDNKNGRIDLEKLFYRYV